MPESCAAWGCKNRRTVRTKNQGITFHKFPQQKALRRQWEAALRRRGFSASSSSVLCSAHFRPEDLDTTGQIVRVRAGVRPSVFCFSKSLQPPGVRHGSTAASDRTRTSRSASHRAAVTPCLSSCRRTVPPAVPCPPSAVPSPPSAVPSVPSPPPAVPSPPPAPPSPPVSTEAEPQSNVQDHSYALPESFSDLKTRLSEALSRVDSLEREMRNAKDRERRAKSMLHFLLAYLRRKNLLNEELKERFSFYSGKII
ncbi:THAP domain-containing protein 3-like [Salarias fasciatus]|uniref:THAP domain-containing protein 3-like n=1 Tax=Salarias fasciatus TaxID=181472 RepID=UPI0011768F01|nr:THAP domain-containing protein 3-like [Salarias fasciatus]